MVSKVIAIGGGGFLMEPENPLLDQYCLDRTGKTVPKVCFIPTASGDSEDFLSRFYRTHLTSLRWEDLPKDLPRPTQLSIGTMSGGRQEWLRN